MELTGCSPKSPPFLGIKVANRPAFPGIILQFGPSFRCPGVVYSDPAISVTPTLTSDFSSLVPRSYPKGLGLPYSGPVFFEKRIFRGFRGKGPVR